MKKIIPLLVIVSLAACNRYQYLSFNSSTVSQNEQKEFTVENDSLRIIYSFAGINAPVNIRIFNKLDQPLRINWQRSAVVINDRAISYAGYVMNMDDGTVSGSAGMSSNSGGPSIGATETPFYNGQLIPPHGNISKSPMGLTNDFFYGVPKSAFRPNAKTMFDGNVVTVKEADFTEENTPLRFTSYLIVAGEDVTAKPVVYEHSFYVDHLFRTLMGPGQFPPGQSWVKKPTGFGKGMATGFGIVAEAAIVGAADAWTEKVTGRPVKRYYPYDHP